MEVRQLMSRDVKTVGPEETIRNAAELMRVHDIGFLPVTKQERVVGAVTDRDLVVRALARGLGPETRVGAVMTEDVVYCFEEDTPHEAAARMEKEGVRRLLVLNGKMALQGVLAIEDLASLPGEAPEIAESLAHLS
jgi:CBS domain-containing protein